MFEATVYFTFESTWTTNLWPIKRLCFQHKWPLNICVDPWYMWQVRWWPLTTSVPLASACHLGVTVATAETEKQSVTSLPSFSPTTVASVSRLHSQLLLLLLLYIFGYMPLCADWQNLPIKTDSKAEFCSVASSWSFTVCTSKSDLCDLCCCAVQGSLTAERQKNPS